MKKEFLPLPKGLTSQSRNGLIIISAYFSAGLIATILLPFQLIKAPSWQLWAAEIVFFAFSIITGMGLWLARRGHIEAGIWLTTSTALIAATFFTVAFSGMGVILFLCAVILNTLVAILTLQSWQAMYHSMAGIAMGVLILLVDRLIQTQRLNIAGLQTLVYVLAAILILIVIYFIFSQFPRFNVRTKLLLSILLITALSVGIYGFFTYLRTQQFQISLTDQLQTTVSELSEQQLNEVAQSQALLADQTLAAIASEVEQLTEHQASLFNQQTLLGQGAYWDARTKVVELPGGQHGNSQSDVASVFVPNTFEFTDELISDLNTSVYLDFVAPGVLRSNPNIVALYFNGTSGFSLYYPNIDLAANVPADYDFISQSFYDLATPDKNPERQTVWTKVYQDPAGAGLIVTSSAPVYDRNDQFRGVLSADIKLSNLTKNIATIKVGQTGFAFLTAATGNVIAMPAVGYDFFELSEETVPVGESPKATVLGHGSVSLQAVTRQMLENDSGLAIVTRRDYTKLTDTSYYFVYATMPSVGYRIGLVVPLDEVNAPILATRARIDREAAGSTRMSLVLLLALLMATAVASFFISRLISKPIVELTSVAEKISAGNLSEQAQVVSQDETGRLATTFNKMTSQLRDVIGSLEQRVADRTRNLELAAEVGRSVSQVRDLNTMLKEAVELIRAQFDLYYVQVYLPNPAETDLVLEAGTGAVGAELLSRRHQLLLNTTSINGRAAVERHAIVITDTASSSTFRPNPLLPDTRSELAIPLTVGEKVVGVLDLQSGKPGALTEDMLPAFNALAGQLAIAIQNAKLVADVNEARAEVEKQAQRLVRTTWDGYLDAIHTPEQSGFAFEGDEVIPLDRQDISAEPNAVSVPIAITGEPLGSLVVELGEEMRTGQNLELINTVARQVAQQLESIRLLESAERFQFEAEMSARRSTVEGWKQYIESRPEGRLGYMYDTRAVLPLDKEPDAPALSLPIKAHDEPIGKVSILGLDAQDNASLELVKAVVERLSAHIESLRLLEDSKRSQAEVDKRARELQSVAEISTVSSRELDIQKMLETVVHLTQRRFHLYHAHVFIYDEQTEQLAITACGWQEGDVHEGTHGTTVVSLNQQQSIVARAAREKRAVIVNDVRNDPGWLPNPLLPDTRSEMAVPLLVGAQLLGVLDVQQDFLNGFTEEDIAVNSTLATQVATALLNARTFAQAQRQAERESMLNVINQKIQSATSVEAVLQIAARELGRALGAPMTIAQLSMKETSS